MIRLLFFFFLHIEDFFNKSLTLDAVIFFRKIDPDLILAIKNYSQFSLSICNNYIVGILTTTPHLDYRDQENSWV